LVPWEGSIINGWQRDVYSRMDIARVAGLLKPRVDQLEEAAMIAAGFEPKAITDADDLPRCFSAGDAIR
jgi:hypothetical protein